MEETYGTLQVIARSWGAVFMFLIFLGVVLFTLRPGSRKIHHDTARIPFRHDDKPAHKPAPRATLAPATAPDRPRQGKEARP
ncbi:MAG: cbb3-type cytochrome c oxidase subunit 3 [Rhodobacteraceae bacterium]|nr:cbb3-type cytochrome c oxidase subunit 3 [Paracoccaceae bacterium]